MKKSLLLFALGLMMFKANSQNCGTPTNFPNTLPTYTYQSGKLYDEAPVCVRVFFHIVRNTAGTTGFNAANIPLLLNNLNQAYNPHNIVIVNQGNDNINNDTYGVEFNDGEFNALTQVNNVSNAINIYLLPVDVSGTPAYAGKASGIPSNSLVVASTFILTSTLPHELGHCLNLFHTHHQLEGSGTCDETSSGKTCSSCGDYVCDTPIDPLLACGGNVDAFTCAYTGGGGFTPLTNNIMSYSCRACRTAFTGGQGLRMRISLNFDPLLSNFRTVDCINITGPNPVCTNGLYTINNVPAGSTVAWRLSNTNYATISRSGNNCTVTRTANGSVTLICNITTPTGNLIATKDLTLGTGNTMSFTQKTITCENGKPYFYGAVSEVPFAGNNYNWYAKDMSNPSNPFVLKQSGLGNTADFPLGNNNGNRYYTIRVIVTSTCGTSQTIDAEGYMYAPPCSGSSLRVNLSPNPSSGLLALNFMDEIPKNSQTNVKVFDLSGNLKFQRNYNVIGNKLQIDLRAVRKGNYFLKISNESNEISIKIVLQ